MKESLHFEAKRAADKLPESFWETYSAFSNTDGGEILLGASEDRQTRALSVTGVNNPEQMVENIWSGLNNSNKVNRNILRYDDISIETREGKNTISVIVPRAIRTQKPVYVNGNQNNGTYKRNGQGDYHCSTDEINEMVADARTESEDSKILAEYGIDSLNMETVESYRSRLRVYKSTHRWLKENADDFLVLIGAADRTEGKICPTLAGLLMFGEITEIKKEIPNYFLDYREESGDSRWDYRFHSDSCDWSGNIFDFVEKTMAKLSTSIGGRFILGKSAIGISSLGDSDDFTMAREAVMNAVIHSMYRGRQGISVVLKPNSLSVSNPGSMRIPIEIAKKGGKSDPRNSKIMSMFAMIGYVERIGSGIKTMEDANRNGQLRWLNIQEEFDPSRVTVDIGFNSGQPSICKEGDRIMAAIADNPKITVRELSLKTGISVSKINGILAMLKNGGYLTRIGGTRGEWRLNDPSFREIMDRRRIN